MMQSCFMHRMARTTLAERLSAMDQPDHASEADAIWTSVRPLLVLGRIVMVGLIIIVGEIFDDVRFAGLTIGVWALVMGIPLFLLISTVITYVDRLVGVEEKNKSSVNLETKNQKEMQ